MKWSLDTSHSEVRFKVKHMVISTVSGSFLDFNASAETDDTDFFNGKFKFEAKIDSINTNNPQRDEHLKSADFFDAAQFPTMSFEGEFDGGAMTGNLQIKGVSKPVELVTSFGGVITDPYGNTRAGFEVEGEINRKDFGLNWHETIETGGLVVSDKVKLMVNLEFVAEK